MVGVAKGIVVERAAGGALDWGCYGDKEVGVWRVVELEMGVSASSPFTFRNWWG